MSAFISGIPHSGYRQHDDRMECGTYWRDSTGDVRLFLSYTSGLAQGVVYVRDEQKYQLGDRRFLRDFVRVSRRTRSGRGDKAE